jgi:hypothetical protein
MLLGGLMMTSFAAWIIANIVRTVRLSSRRQLVLKMVGLWGILDLPFYVIFPQLGLRHWIVLGGHEPEPLIGARMMGIPDPVFYLAIVLSTIGLNILYFRSLCEKAAKPMKMIWERFGAR